MKNKTYHIITIGCQMNKNDSERIASYLDSLGLVYEEDRESSDLVIITTCGVRQSAETRIFGLIPRLKQKNPNNTIILTGCLSGRDDVKEKLKKNVDIWLPITNLPKLAEMLEMKSENGSLNNYLGLDAKYSSSFSAFVPIGNGCDNFCTYCVVPYARGREIYRSADEIVNEVKKLVKKGYKEINLIAQNVNSYIDSNVIASERQRVWQSRKFSETRDSISRCHSLQNDSGVVNFSILLKLVDEIPGDFWIRFATNHPKDMSDELIDAIKDCEKVCKHIHLPVQSGDDEILKRMNRGYSVEHYRQLIEKIRNTLNIDSKEPTATITTDIIVGFPGETLEQFGNTKKLLEDVGFDMAYVSQFSPRPGTMAEKMDDNISKPEKKKREEELMKVIRKTSLENNKKYLNKELRILVEGKRKDLYFGRTATNKVVKLKVENQKPARSAINVGGPKVKIGEFVDVKIVDAKELGLVGEIV